ncbi:tetratricopeptide repeat protein [Candidatus Gracilibacteria bacterium]|nr:tetratricopeptide repeat protein [Candidatus Gracilibacteria bacterium]
MRAALLDEWQRDRPDELHALHLKLHEYFSRRTTPPGSARRAQTTLIGATMLVNVMPGNPQADLLRREALYHLLCADTQRGLRDLRSAWDEVEESYRLADAEVLLQVAAEAPPAAQLQAWLMYMRGRASQLALNLTNADEQFSTLLSQRDLDPELAARTSRALGEVRAETGQWADATDRHRYSLDYYQRTGDTRAAADTMMLLGEAYQGLGVSTGSWHLPPQYRNPLFAFVSTIWNWTLALPFVLIGLVLGRGNRALPLARYCARYQNWLLIRLYNTARGWYRQGLAAYETRKDERGILRAEQRLADILTLYGYPHEAITRIETLLALPVAADPYRRAWLERSLADAYLAAGDATRAQELLERASSVFNELGDVRRAASLLDLQGRAAIQAGDEKAALGSFAASLTRFRGLRYAAARERILHALRVWRRRPDIDPGVLARIDAMIRAEPEKRYVGRFIRSYTPLLQLASVLAIPLGLLLAAIFVPTLSINVLNGGVFSVRTFYDPLRFFSVILTLVPFFLAAYGALALGVIFLLPTARIAREQPHVIVTTPEAITRYNQRGEQAITMTWRDIRRWLSLDRCIWDEPMPLYSRSFLEDTDGRDLEIDGITGWYTDLKDDIAQRLASSGNRVSLGDLGYHLLKSTGGVSVSLGIVLLLLFTWTINGWLPFPYLLPPPILLCCTCGPSAVSGFYCLWPIGWHTARSNCSAPCSSASVIRWWSRQSAHWLWGSTWGAAGRRGRYQSSTSAPCSGASICSLKASRPGFCHSASHGGAPFCWPPWSPRLRLCCNRGQRSITRLSAARQPRSSIAAELRYRLAPHRAATMPLARHATAVPIPFRPLSSRAILRHRAASRCRTSAATKRSRSRTICAPSKQHLADRPSKHWPTTTSPEY